MFHVCTSYCPNIYHECELCHTMSFLLQLQLSVICSLILTYMSLWVFLCFIIIIIIGNIIFTTIFIIISRVYRSHLGKPKLTNNTLRIGRDFALDRITVGGGRSRRIRSYDNIRLGPTRSCLHGTPINRGVDP